MALPKVGKMFSDFFGSTNKEKVATPQVDPNAYQYGGHPGGADEAANRYQQQAEQAQGRQGEQVNYGQANSDRARGLQARAGQNTIAQAQQARALGQVPSIAGMQADRQMQQAAAAQASASASARGPAAMALAQQNAANNTANAQSDISGQAQINAANERMQAEQAASGAYGNMRAGDLQSQGQAAQQSQYQAGINAQQRAQNDQYSQAMTADEMGVRNSQLTAGMNQQAQQSANALGAGQINAGVGGQNAAMNQQNAMGVLGTVSSIAGGLAAGGGGGTPPPKAKGGPVSGGRPYLVGEQGPELVIPKHDGIVIPAGPTAALLGGPVPRATGGPIQAGGAPPAMIAPSTWGTGGPDVVGQTQAMLPAAQAQDAYRDSSAAADRLHQWDQEGYTHPGGSAPIADIRARQGKYGSGPKEDFVNPYKRDVDEVAALRRVNPDLVNEQDIQRERVGRAMSGQKKPSGETTNDDRKPAAKASEAPPKFSVGKMVAEYGDRASKQAASIDTSYHGSGGVSYTPHLLAIGGARAFGGPIQAGGASDIGGVVDIGGGGSGISADMVKRASTGLGGGGIPGTVGGGGVVGGTNVPGGFSGRAGGALAGLGAAMQHMAGAVDTSYHPFGGAREQGGPVDSGKSYLTGERGPEIVLPLYEPPGKQLHQDAGGHAFYADDPSADDGRPSLAGRGEQRTAPPPSMMAPKAKAPPKQREMTPEELSAWADQQMRGLSSDHAARMAQGPSVRSPSIGQFVASMGRRR